MLKLKKIISIALVVVMALSMFVMNTSALEAGKTFGFVVESDKKVSEIVPGATVTVTIRYEMSDFSQLMSDIRFALLFDDTVYTPVTGSRTYLNDAANYAKDATPFTVNPTFATTTMSKSSMSAEEQAKYNSCVMQVMSADASLGATNKAGYSVTEDPDMPGVSVPEISIQFTVSGDVAAIAAGNINIALCDTSVSTAQYIKQTNNDGKAPAVINQANVSMEKANILANMAPAASSIIKDGGSNIRFRGIGQNGTAADYTGEGFDVRTVATISEADFKAKFTDDATAIEKITDIGFVYAAKSKVATFDVATAKAVAQGTAAEGYVKAPVTYIQHAADGADYRFTCLIKNIPDADKTDAVSALAYVCFDGEYIFADAAIVADYTELYARMPK